MTKRLAILLIAFSFGFAYARAQVSKWTDQLFIIGNIRDQAGLPADSVQAIYVSAEGVFGKDISDENGEYTIILRLDNPVFANKLSTFPNPALYNGIQVAYRLDRTTDVKLAIYDALGRQTRLLENSGQKAPGQYMVRWDATNDAGEPVATGIYFCRLETQGGQYVWKMTLLKSSGGIGGATSVNLDTFPIDGTLSFEDLHAEKKYDSAQFQLILNGEETVGADYELNRIPSLDNLAEHYSLQEGGSLIINPVVVDDTGGGTIDVKVEGSVDGAYTVTKVDSGYKITANGDYYTTADFDRIILTARDDDGATSAPRIIPLVTHNVNDPPMTNGEIPDFAYDIAQGDTMLYNIAPFFTDVDTDVLSYQVIGGDGSITVDENGLLSIPKLDPGTSLEIAVQASDGEYAVASNTFRIDMPIEVDQTPWFTQLEVPDYVGDSLKVAWETALADQGQNPNYVDLKVGDMQVASNLPAAGYGSWDATRIEEGTNLVIGLVKKGELDSLGVSNSFIVDHTKPHVESIDGFLSGEPNNPFMIQFNQYNADGVTPEALDNLSITITDLSTGAQADATYTVNYETNQVQVTPSGLENGRSYRLEVNSSDKAGNIGEAFVFDAPTGFVWKDLSFINFNEGGMQEITLADVIASGDYSGMTLHATSQDTSQLYAQNLPTSVIIGARNDRFNTSENNPVNVLLKIINNQGITVDSTLATPTVNMMTDLEGNVYVADHENLRLVPVPGAQVIAPGGVEAVADASGYYHLKITPQALGLVTVKHPGGEAEAYDRPEWVMLDSDKMIPFGLVKGDVDIFSMEKGHNTNSLEPLAMIDVNHPLVTVQEDSILVPFYFNPEGLLSQEFGEIAEDVLKNDLFKMYGVIGYMVDTPEEAFGIIHGQPDGPGGSVVRKFNTSRTLIQGVDAYFSISTDHINPIRKNVILIELGKGFTSGGDWQIDPNENLLWQEPKREIYTEYYQKDIDIGRTIKLINPVYGNVGYSARNANINSPRR